MAHVTFWFEFASTYSYLSAMRIEEMSRKADVDVIWKPFLLGPIFKAQNWDTSPFNLHPAKGRYMVRDIERIAKARGLVFRLPNPFPQNGLLAARLALVGLEEGWGPVIRTVFTLCRRAQNRNRLNAPSRIPGGDHGSARVWPSPLSDRALAARFMANTLRPPPSVKTKVVNRSVPRFISGQIHPFNGPFVAKGEAPALLSGRR